MHNKLILHVDGDNFFVACEVQRFPHLKGTPVVVGEERGIASALSKEAKLLGVTRGMPIFEIRKLYPTVTVLPSHFELYEQYNQKLYTILQRYSDTVERYSIDECFALLPQDDIHLLPTIHKEIETALGITVSIGLAHTKTLAKIASKKEKPSGCVSLIKTDMEKILEETPVGSVWGIGRAISAKLTSYNIHTALDFTKQGRQFIERNFGSNTLDTWYELQGTQRLEVQDSDTASRDQKSFQSTRSFGMSTKERSFILSELCIHAEVLTQRLRRHNLLTNHISFFLKKNTSHQRYLSTDIELPFYTNNPSDILGALQGAFKDLYDDQYMYKATGISIYKLKPVECVQGDLFGVQSAVQDKNSYLEVLDMHQRKFGDESIHTLGSLEARIRRRAIQKVRNQKNQFVYGLPLPYMGEVS